MRILDVFLGILQFKFYCAPDLLERGIAGSKRRKLEQSYTHHQKTVIVDADAGLGKRKIIAFVGGLDLCTRRYDSPDHPIFRTLHTFHKDDHHNPTFTGPMICIV